MNYFNAGMYTMNMYQYMAKGTEGIKNAEDAQKTNTASAKNETFSEVIKRKSKQEESAVDKYKKKHPKDAWHVESQVRAGQRVLAKNNAENVSREDMTMEEYKQFFTGLMNSIPYDVSQRNDMNVWTISEKGWEQMKNDPQYEAWVLGYTSEDRSVHNPWAAMPGYSPNYHTESFGASIEEHLGQSGPMGGMERMGKRKTQRDDEEESWWVRRNKIMTEKLMEAVAEKAEQERAVDYDEKAFDMIAPNAPQDVKDAWMEAAEEVNSNGLGIRGNGMMSHISQLTVFRLNKMLMGETGNTDILGNTVESAIKATQQALQNLEYPLAPAYRSVEAKQARIKERAFYTAFLKKLGALAQ